MQIAERGMVKTIEEDIRTAGISQCTRQFGKDEVPVKMQLSFQGLRLKSKVA